jgi:hypothetical protein
MVPGGAGGGVVYITVTTNFTNKGSISAQGQANVGAIVAPVPAGAGGSVSRVLYILYNNININIIFIYLFIYWLNFYF